LSWFDERTDWLAELVASLAAVGVDHLVAVDGAYGLYPGARGSSGSEQASVVLGAAHGAGIGVTVHVPAFPWPGNEVEKRTVLFALGHLVAQPYDDWLVVADADEVWESGDLRADLVDCAADVAEVMLVERNPEHGDQSQMIRKCFRAQNGGIRVVGGHWQYYSAAGECLWGPENVQADQLMDVRVRHRPGERGSDRTRKRLAYYDRRTQTGIEAAA
jgi:hypothetical protein